MKGGVSQVLVSWCIYLYAHNSILKIKKIPNSNSKGLQCIGDNLWITYEYPINLLILLTNIKLYKALSSGNKEDLSTGKDLTHRDSHGIISIVKNERVQIIHSPTSFLGGMGTLFNLIEIYSGFNKSYLYNDIVSWCYYGS